MPGSRSPASQIWIYARDKMIIITDDELPYMILSRLYLSGDSERDLESTLHTQVQRSLLLSKTN